MLNNSYLNTILKPIENVPSEFWYVNMAILVTYDKHYPGIKRIQFETFTINRNGTRAYISDPNQTYFNHYIEYNEILKIFNVEKSNSYVMKGMANYFLEFNALKKDYDNIYRQSPVITLPEFEITESNYAMDSGIKYVNIKLTNESLAEQAKCILHTINHKAKEYAQIIKTLKDLYV